MSKILVYQPHFDDAVWSIAEHMLTWQKQGHDVAIVTVCGWTGAEKENILGREHMAVMARMKLYGWEHPLKDDAHPQAGNRFDVAQEMAEVISADLDREAPDVVVSPRGIHHPDHLDVAWACGMAVTTERWIYEELPYYVLYPELVSGARQTWERLKCDDYFATKRYLCAMYESQWAPNLRRTVFAPERIWRIPP